MRKEGTNVYEEPSGEAEKPKLPLLEPPTQGMIIDAYAGVHVDQDSPRYQVIAGRLFSGKLMQTRMGKMLALAQLHGRDISGKIERIYCSRAIRQLKFELNYLISSAVNQEEANLYKGYLDTIQNDHRFPDINIKLPPLREPESIVDGDGKPGETNLLRIRRKLNDSLPGELSVGGGNDTERIRENNGQGEIISTSPQSTGEFDGLGAIDKIFGSE